MRKYIDACINLENNQYRKRRKMKTTRKFWSILTILIVASMVLVACGAPATEAPAAQPTEPPAASPRKLSRPQ